jgi:hypothetical protein
MDDYDRSNLLFLLNASPEVLEDWWDTVDEDDREYASELLTTYAEELRVRQSFMDAEDVELTPDASSYLEKFKLNKK